MPYRRRRFQRKRSRRKRFYKGPKNLYRKVNAAYYMMRKMKSTYHPEFKLKDVSSSQDVDASGFVAHLTGISQGNDYANRIGRAVTIKSLYFRFTFKIYSNTTIAGFQQIRVYIVHALTDAIPTFSIIQDGSVGDAFTCPRNVDYTKDYKVIYDKVINLQCDKTNVISFNKFFKRNSVCKWTAGNSSATAIDYGHYYLMAIGDLSSNLPTVDYMCRVRFVDE
jgi:hypothetical protein